MAKASLKTMSQNQFMVEFEFENIFYLNQNP